MKSTPLAIFFLSLVLSPLFSSLLAQSAAAAELSDQISHFAFGSCAKERKPQPIWDTIIAQDPQLFLFIGDNHYADVWMADGKTLAKAPVTDPKRLQEAYAELGAKPGYQQLVKQVPVLATWDDHDYGADDGGKHYPLKAQSQQAFLDFFGYAEDDPLRTQKGIYYSKTMGQADQRVQFIFLDTRYHRDDLTPNPQGRPQGKGPYVPSTDTSISMLGDAQWAWLAEQLRQPANIRFIISSIQVVAHEHGWESWGTMPHERQRLFDLIGQTEANGVVFLSGDRHLTEVSVEKGSAMNPVPYPIWDLTSSGMTDGVKTVNEANQYRVGTAYRGSHFGTVTIHWGEAGSDTHIEFNAITDTGKLIHSHRIAVAELAANG